MKKLILGALALAFVSTATVAGAKTWTFDLFTSTTTYPPLGGNPTTTLTNQGSGTFSFTGPTLTMANAKANEPTFSVYEPVSFNLNLDFTSWAWSDREMTIGRVRVGRTPGSTVCIYNPSTGCTPGPTSPPTNFLAVDFIGGSFSLGSPNLLSNWDLSEENLDLVFSNATGLPSMTINQTSPYGVSNGPVSLRLMNIQALTVAAPVPEPGEWAMIVAGLGVVGAAARRRRAA